MNRKSKIINIVLSIILPVACLLFVLFFAKKSYFYDVKKVMLYTILGAITFGIFNVFFHELGHVVFGKIKGFTLINFTFLFFSFTKLKRGFSVSLVSPNDCMGSTELVSKNTKNLKNKVKFMSLGGVFFNFIVFLSCLSVFLLTKKLPLWAFIYIGVGAPISLYYFLSNTLPMHNYGARNDGGVIWGLNHGDDESKVMLSIYAIESLLYQGKTPSEIDKEFYFNQPQLPEDSLTYLSLLCARYLYYLDIDDYENAKKVCARFISLFTYLPRNIIKILKTYLLYSYCTFDFNEERADKTMLEIQRYLNSKNDAFNLIVKLAYILNVEKRNDVTEVFVDKCKFEADKMKISGLERFYLKLIEKY